MTHLVLDGATKRATAHLDDAHRGDIIGAFGTIAQDDILSLIHI